MQIHVLIYILFLNYKLELSKRGSNSTRLVELEVCAIGKRYFKFFQISCPYTNIHGKSAQINIQYRVLSAGF
jgi:hypothetical protein